MIRFFFILELKSIMLNLKEVELNNKKENINKVKIGFMKRFIKLVIYK